MCLAQKKHPSKRTPHPQRSMVVAALAFTASLLQPGLDFMNVEEFMNSYKFQLILMQNIQASIMKLRRQNNFTTITQSIHANQQSKGLTKHRAQTWIQLKSLKSPENRLCTGDSFRVKWFGPRMFWNKK